MDVYTEMRTLRANNEALKQYKVFLKGFGNIGKTNTTSTERYVMCMSGTRIVPYDTTHQLGITGTIITDDKQEGLACFDKNSLTVTTMVDITYAPKQVEVITVTTGGSALTPDEHDALIEVNADVDVLIDRTDTDRIADIWNMLGLDDSDSITIGNGKYLSTLLDIDVTDNGNGTYTLSRQ